jgi:hypothetical protein
MSNTFDLGADLFGPAPVAKTDSFDLGADLFGPTLAVAAKPADMSWGDVGTGFVQTIIPSTGRLAGQAVQGLAAVSIPVAKGFVKTVTNPVGAATDVYNFVTSPQGQQQLTGIAKAIGGDLANRYGSVEAIKQGLATDSAVYLSDLSLALGSLGYGVKAIGTAGKIPTLVKIGATTGKIGAAADPFALGASALKGTSKVAAKILPEPVTTTLGKIGGIPGRVASTVREYGSNVLDPVTNWLKKTGDAYLPELQQAAKQAPKEPLPGVTSTFGERVAQAQIPVVKPVAGEAKIFKKGASTEVNARELARKKVMAEHVGSIGGGEKTLEAMEKVKEKSRAVDYAKVDTKVVKADPELLGILDRADKAVKKAQEIAKVDGREFVAPFDIRSEVEKAYSAGGPLSIKGGTMPATAVPQFSGETLSTIDKVLGDAQKGFLSESRVGPAEATAYKNLQKEYRAWLAKKENLPELKIAQENFAHNSQRIQKTQIAEYLKKKVGDIHNPAGEKEYLALLEDEPRLIKEATGDDTFSKLSDVGFNEFDTKKLKDVKLKAEQRRETERYVKLGKGEDVSVGEPWKHVSVLNIWGTLLNMGAALRGEALSKRAATTIRDMLLKPENGKLAEAYGKAIAQGDKRLAADTMRKLLAKKAAKVITHPATVTAGRINALQTQEPTNNIQYNSFND